MAPTLRCQPPTDPFSKDVDRRFAEIDRVLDRVRTNIFDIGKMVYDMRQLGEPVPDNCFNALTSEIAYVWEGLGMALSRASGYSVTLVDEAERNTPYPQMDISGCGSDALGYALQGRESSAKLKGVDARTRRLFDLYRLTVEEWERILTFQKGVCAISKEPAGSKRLATDHCHKTGRIRGLLDWRMNRAIAMFGDDPKLLRAAADYLERPPAPRALGKETYGLIGRAKKKRKMVYGPPVIG